jgi:anti-sigma factor RsiW
VRALAPQFMQTGFEGREGAAAEAHLNECPLCQHALEGLLEEPAITPRAPRFHAPPVLRDRVTRAIEAAAPRADVKPEKGRYQLRMPEWLKLGMVSFATAVLMAAFLLPMRYTVADDTTADALIASHVRWSRLDKLIDVPTSDRHTVKPWLSQKLGYSPLVPDLRDAGYDLVGGRIDYAENRFVGTMVYKRREHVIDVYAWPDAGKGRNSGSMSHNGYHAVKWTVDDITYWAVSDLNADELKQFADLYARAS